MEKRNPPKGPLYALLPKGGGSTSRSKLISSFIFSFSLLFFVWKGKSIEEKMKKKPSRSHRSVWTPAMSSGVFKAVTTGNWCLWKFIPFLFVLWNKLTGIQLRLNICNSRGVESCPLLDVEHGGTGGRSGALQAPIYYLSPGRGWDRGTTVSGRGEVGVERELEVVGVLKTPRRRRGIHEVVPGWSMGGLGGLFFIVLSTSRSKLIPTMCSSL